MFSSGGYFRGFNCPFFASGLCERPYCHYRHVKTEEEKVQSKAASSGYSDAQIEEDLTIGNGPASLKGEAVKVNKYTGEPEIQTAEKTDVGVLPQEHVNKYTGEPMVAQPSNEYVVEVKSHCKKYKPTDKKYNGEFMGAEPVNEYTVEVNSNCRKYNPTNKKYNGGPMVTKPSNEYTVEVKSDCKKYNPTDKHYDGEQITQPSNEYTVELNSNCKKYRPTDKQSLKSQRPKLQIHKPVQKLNKYTGEPVVDIVDKQTYTPEAKDFPEYNPTPINQLKPSLSKYQAGTLDNENEQEYDPQSNFSTTSLLKPSQPMAIKRTFTYDPTTPDFNHPAKRAKGDLEEAGPEDDKDESDDGEMGMFSEDEEEEEIRIPTLADSSEEEDSSKPSIITDVKVFENLLLPVMDHDNNSNETSGDTKKKLPKSVKKSHTEKDHAKKIRTREKSSNHEKISSKSSVSNENKKNGHSHKERTSSKFDSSKSSKHSSSSKSRENSSSRASSSKSSVKDSTKSVEKQSSSHSSDKSSSKHTHHKSSTSSSSKPKSSNEKETPKKYSSSSKQKNEHSKHSAHDKSSNKQDHRKHSTDKKNEQTGKSHKKHESSEHHKHESSGHSKHESSGPSKHESRSKSSKETSKDSVKGESKKRDRSVSLDSNGSKRKIVDINLDLFGMDSDEEDSIPPLISDEEEEDPYEECLRIYNESNVSKPSPKKKSRTERSISETEQSESVSIPGKKRTAHKGSREVTRKIPEKPHSKLSPAQIMHNRFVMMQKQAQEEAGRSQEASTSSSSGKQRVAHQSNVNQKVKNGREGTKVVDGKTVVATASKTQKRTAHVPNVKNIKRPTIPAEYGSKVPISVRQRYLNSIIDECLHLYDNEEDAYKRGLEEELTVYKRASNKTVYLNVACNTIKRLRTEVAELTASPTKPTSPLKMSHEAVLGGKNATRTTYTLNRSGGSTKGPIENFKGSELYNRLARYIMTEEQLQENGFPRPDSENSSVAKIYTVSQQEQNSAKLKTHEKICVRCGKRFMVFPNGTYAHQEECSYHWGKAWKKKIAGYIETRYTCCQGDLGTEGCQIAKCHVHETNKWENRTGYMKTLPCSPVPDGDYGVYAMDCEMVYTQGGVELARVTVTDCENSSVYETLVRPDRKIIDYNTRFSGITNEDMVGVTTTIRDVQAVLLSLFTEKTILIGHSLESDLAAVKIIHDTVVDTSVVFPHRLGPPYKRALKTLMAEYMKKIIQDDVGGHDSQEDAISCMELMQWRVKEDARKEPRCS